MQIRQASVSQLFGIFDHEIVIRSKDRITIIHGPNGFGKTAILRMIDGLFNSRYQTFRDVPFKEFKIEFDNGDVVEIAKEVSTNQKPKPKEKIQVNFYPSDSDKKTFTLKKAQNLSERDLDFPVSLLDDMVPGLERIGMRRWAYTPTGEVLSLNEVMTRFEEIIPAKAKLAGEPEWLGQIKSNINVRLIESQRLLDFSTFRNSTRIHSGRLPMLSTVSSYSEEIASLIQSKLAEYGAKSQSLDRTFPARVVRQQPSLDLTDDQLRNQLSTLEETRSQLIEVGLLDKDENSDFQIQRQVIDERTKNILSVYVNDVEEKLSVFKEIASKIELLRRIVNKKFLYSYKEMNFSKRKGFVFKTLYHPTNSNKDAIAPTDLSSGEQHELVLLYELLFKVKPKSLVLIDEPELSLHVGWQAQFLKDLQEITKLTDLNVLMATHSPDIIQDRWDLTIELKGPRK